MLHETLTLLLPWDWHLAPVRSVSPCFMYNIVTTSRIFNYFFICILTCFARHYDLQVRIAKINKTISNAVLGNMRVIQSCPLNSTETGKGQYLKLKIQEFILC